MHLYLSSQDVQTVCTGGPEAGFPQGLRTRCQFQQALKGCGRLVPGIFGPWHLVHSVALRAGTCTTGDLQLDTYSSSSESQEMGRRTHVQSTGRSPLVPPRSPWWCLCPPLLPGKPAQPGRRGPPQAAAISSAASGCGSSGALALALRKDWHTSTCSSSAG